MKLGTSPAKIWVSDFQRGQLTRIAVSVARFFLRGNPHGITDRDVSMSQALAIFKLLAILGPAIKELWPLILETYESGRKLWEAAQKLIPASEQDTGILGVVSDELDAEELEAEAVVVAAFSAGESAAMFDLSRLRAIGKWAKANPKAAEMFISVLTKLVPLFGG